MLEENTQSCPYLTGFLSSECRDSALFLVPARDRRLGDPVAEEDYGLLGDEARARFLIVIPAHDEESGVGLTVASCRASAYPESLFGVLVIADNCSDRTAEVAADAGTRVVSRFDPDTRVKATRSNS